MKSEKLFKILIDLIFVLQILGFITLIFVIPSFTFVKINMQDTSVQNWTIFHWLLLLTSFSSYVLFVFGIFYLRKFSKTLLTEKYFSIYVISNAMKIGKMFVYSGSIMILLYLIQFISRFTNGKIQLVYNTEFVFSLFIIAIGLFFLILSKILNSGVQLKQENDLTI